MSLVALLTLSMYPSQVRSTPTGRNSRLGCLQGEEERERERVCVCVCVVSQGSWGEGVQELARTAHALLLQLVGLLDQEVVVQGH